VQIDEAAHGWLQLRALAARVEAARCAGRFG
jgi:hypothetical protein